MKNNPARLGGSSKSKPTWWATLRHSTTSAFFVFCGRGREDATPHDSIPRMTFIGVVQMKRLWIAFGVVMIFSFSVLGWVGTRIYQEAPPLPDQVIATDG